MIKIKYKVPTEKGGCTFVVESYVCKIAACIYAFIAKKMNWKAVKEWRE